MVRHNKRHSRKKGGKGGKSRGRGRRQSGGMWKITDGWKSVITADDNVVHDLTTSTIPATLEEGVDIKYRVSQSREREWLIGGKEYTVGELLQGAKGGRYINVIEVLKCNGVDLPDLQKGIILTDAEFCKFFIRYMNVPNLTFTQMLQKQLAYKYYNVTPAVMNKIGSDAVTNMCKKWNSEWNSPDSPSSAYD